MADKVLFHGNGEFAIHVPDLARAQGFYEDVLGLRLRSYDKNMLGFDAGQFRLYVNRDPQVQPCIPSFDIADVAKARAYLLAAGSKLTRENPSGFYFTDPFGLTLDAVKR